MCIFVFQESNSKNREKEKNKERKKWFFFEKRCAMPSGFGRLSESIKIPIPTQTIRMEILQSLNSYTKEINEIISKKTVGYLPKDLILPN